MSDAGELFRTQAEATKRHRAEMLAKADTSGWTRHTDFHFSRYYGRDRIEWWPSGGKAKFKGRMVYGHRKVNELIARLNSQVAG
jgi:hypothetical protein